MKEQLEKIKSYLAGIQFEVLSMEELADYTKIIIMIEQAEKNEKDKEKMLEIVKTGRSNL